MTNQEIYNTVKAHLLAQGEKAIGDRGCAYRGRNGRKCAIGVLIPDDRYDEEFEGRFVNAPTVAEAAGLTEDQLWLARELQEVHDLRAATAWELELMLVANKHGLDP